MSRAGSARSCNESSSNRLAYLASLKKWLGSLLARELTHRTNEPRQNVNLLSKL
jgi:hypothetical protein